MTIVPLLLNLFLFMFSFNSVVLGGTLGRCVLLFDSCTTLEQCEHILSISLVHRQSQHFG